MKSINKSKKGFTLLEVMLAIAIISLIGGLFAALIFAINDSFKRTYNTNDATDYAVLFAKAIENQVISDFQIAAGSHTYTINSYNPTSHSGDNSVCRDGVSVVDFDNIDNRYGNNKWSFYLDGSLGANNVVNITIYVVDQYTNPGELITTYQTSFWLPYHSVVVNSRVSPNNPSLSFNTGASMQVYLPGDDHSDPSTRVTIYNKSITLVMPYTT